MKKISAILTAIFITISLHAQTVSDMLENALSAVVTVAVYKMDYANKTLGYRGDNNVDMAYDHALRLDGAKGSGSGFVITRNGKKYIITNAHVVQDASDERGSIKVYSISGKAYDVRILGGDSFYDIAVLEFITQPGAEITTLDFKKTEPRIGESVYAIGNPLGEFPYSVSSGIISAKNRVRGGYTGKFGFLQTTATIIWGNSGGPLVDQAGKVAGVNTKIAYATSPTGEQVIQSQINFALEAKIAERVVNDIINNNGRVRRAYFGLEISQKSNYRYISKSTYDYVLSDSIPVISGIIPNSPAATIFNQYMGWGITHVGNVEVRSVEEVLGEFEKVLPGASVVLTLKSGSTVKKVSITAGELLDQQLEDIGLYVMDQITKMSLVEKQPNLLVSLNENKYYKYQGNKYSSAPLNKASNSPSSPSYSNYYLIAAGIVNKDFVNMWKTEQLKYFGAVMRICGIAGVVDFYLLKPNDNIENVQTMRHYLSGDENILKETLWY
ncbi:MAG: trypsin-like serine protease [Sphingobacteriales bacterium]|nr:trypsin-like serine protease [Sphingobacteriales bacterium]